MEFGKLKARYEVLKLQKQSMVDTLSLIEQYVLPFRAYFNGDVSSENQVRWRRPEIYDSTAVLAAQTLAANLHSNLTNPASAWFALLTKDKKINQINEVKVWLEAVTDLVYQTLQASNFELQINETYLDIVGFGTAVLIEEVNETEDGRLDSVEFNTIPIEECVFETDHRERMAGLYRLLSWTALQIVNKFGIENVPQKIKEAFENPKEAGTRFPVLFSIYRRNEIDLEWASTKRILAPTQRPWAATYHLYTTGDLLSESGYYDMPAFAPRWRKASGSVWGFSQSMVCLSDILTLNKMVELGLKVGEKALDPPGWVTRRGIHSSLDVAAGGWTVVDNKESMGFHKYEGRFDIAVVTREQLVDAIKSAFFVDQLQLKESPAMTATEVQVRYQLMQRLLGPSLGRLQNDLLDPLIERTFKVLYRYGVIPRAPEALVKSGVQFEIEYVGPMARSQRFDTVASIERWMMAVAQLAAVYPEALDVPDIDEVVKELGYSAGVPAKLVKSDSVIVLDRVRKQKMQQMAQQLQLAQGAGAAMKEIGEGQQALAQTG